MDIVSSVTYFLFGPERRIGHIFPNVVIREKHIDTLKITDYPIQRGASVADHAYKEPETLEMDIGWSNSYISFTAPLAKKAAMETRDLRDIYQDLLKLQASREPFSIGTGKREYDNMLIKSLTVETEAKTENVLIVKAVFQRVHIVDTMQVVLVPENQRNAGETAEMSSSGERQPQPVS